MNTLPAFLIHSQNNLRTLPALLRILPPDAPLIAVDDASTDGSLALLQDEEAAGRLMLIARSGQPDRTAALNAGFAYIKEHYPGRDVLRLHADTLPCSPDGESSGAFVRHLSDTLKSLPHCGALGVRLLCADGRILSDGRTTVSGLGLHSPDRDLRRLAPDTPQKLFGPAPEVDSVRGACVLYRYSLLEAISALGLGNAPLDAAYGPAGLEDDDLCFAARLCGFEVRVVPWLRAVHLSTVPPPEGACVPVLHQRLRRDETVMEAQTEYWKLKWGWDMLLPDLGEVRRRYAHSRVCWQINDAWTTTESFPAVDLCMVTWNGERVLQRCLDSLAATDYPADRLVLHVIDNASTDATPDMLRRFAAECPFPVRVTRLEINVGAVAGLNWAFTQGQSPLVAKLDDDIIVPPHWLKEMAAVFRARPLAGVVGPCIVDDTPERRVQCADFSYYPTPFCHEGEAEDSQWPGLARVSHVRGCCNLYRRSVFSRCGMLDLRFSPSQWDDPDHHMALIHAGYEVIYTGRVHVAHKCLTGTSSAPSSTSNAAMNKAKMLAKWGNNSPELVECALLLSREGRFVSDAAQPAPQSGIPALAPPAPELTLRLRHRYNALCAEEDPTPALTGMAAQLRESAQNSLAQGHHTQALGALRTALCCGAQDIHFAKSLAAFAQVLEQLGASATLQRQLIALLELPPPPSLPEAVAVFPSTPPPFSLDATPKVRFRVPHSHRFDASLRELLDAYAHALRDKGISVELDCCAGGEEEAVPHVTHLWTLDSPHETLSQLAWLRLHNRVAVLSPLWRPPSHAVWADGLLERLRGGETGIPTPPDAQEGDAPLLRRMALGMAHVLPLSRAEARLLNMSEQAIAEEDRTLPLPPLSLSASPDEFQNETGLHDFILAVAPFHAAANQATLLAALAILKTPLPVVLVGKARDPWYLRACRRLMPSALFVDEMDDTLLASAFAAARLVALPSLEPCGHLASRAATTAWLLGKPVVVAADSAESALPGVIACNPCDPASVATALERALRIPPAPHTYTAPITALLRAYSPFF